MRAILFLLIMAITIHAEETYDCTYDGYQYRENEVDKTTNELIEDMVTVYEDVRQRIKIGSSLQNIKVTLYELSTKDVIHKYNFKRIATENKKTILGQDEMLKDTMIRLVKGTSGEIIKNTIIIKDTKETLDGNIGTAEIHYWKCKKI
jgi:hypothetical protein